MSMTHLDAAFDVYENWQASNDVKSTSFTLKCFPKYIRDQAFDLARSVAESTYHFCSQLYGHKPMLKESMHFHATDTRLERMAQTVADKPEQYDQFLEVGKKIRSGMIRAFASVYDPVTDASKIKGCGGLSGTESDKEFAKSRLVELVTCFNNNGL